MTLSTTSADEAPTAVSVIVLGTDAVLAARPATPVQLAHACLRAGFANVIPASWGDELIAAAVLARLPQFDAGPAIQCSCPIVAHRLLTTGGDLRPVLLALAPPPVAAARYVRALARPTPVRITYAGICPGAADSSIDVRVSPAALIAMLAERRISLHEQPRMFESIIPPDRRRFRSQAGGVPTPEALWSDMGSRSLVEIVGDDYVAEIAQHLLTGNRVLIDASARLGCACSGAVDGANRRAEVSQLEPPRSSSPILDDGPSIELDVPVPAMSRTPVDVVAVPSTARSSYTVPPAHASEPPFGNRFSPTRASEPVPMPRSPRSSGAVIPRAVLAAFPTARAVEGKSLPRAYVARRRSLPKGISIVLPLEQTPSPTVEHATPAEHVHSLRDMPARPLEPAAEPYAPDLSPIASSIPDASSARAPLAPERQSAVLTPPHGITRPVPPRPTVESAARQRMAPAPATPPTISRGQLVGIIVGVVLLAICASTVIAIIVGRSIAMPPVGR